MSRLHDLIQQLCPNGVPYKTLGEVVDYEQPGKYLVRSTNYDDRFQTPVLTAGQTFVLGYTDEQDGIYPASKDNPVIIFDDFTGAFKWVDFPFKAKSSAMKMLHADERIILLRYVYFWMAQRNFTSNEHKRLWIGHYSSFRIPVPPRAVQEEIARILDRFTALEAELEVELEARKKQYAYYRELLLTFDDAAAKIPCGLRQTDRQTDGFAWRPRPVQWVTLGDVFEMKNGYTPSKREKSFWENGTIPWFRMEDIRANGRILSDSIQHITLKAVKKGKLFPANSIIMATTATIGEHALIIVDSLANQRFTFFTKRESFADKLDMRFAYYYFFLIGEWCKQNVVVSSFPSVDMNRLRNLRFPLPSLAEQGRIVGILDKFEALCGDLSAGLPGEIALRRKQFAYWRERLLDFKEIGA